MVHVSDAAIDVLEAINTPTNSVLRLEPDLAKGALTLSLGEAREGDEVVERQGNAVLHVSGAIRQALDGATIDAVHGARGPQLTVTPAQG